MLVVSPLNVLWCSVWSMHVWYQLFVSIVCIFVSVPLFSFVDVYKAFYVLNLTSKSFHRKKWDFKYSLFISKNLMLKLGLNLYSFCFLLILIFPFFLYFFVYLIRFLKCIISYFPVHLSQVQFSILLLYIFLYYDVFSLMLLILMHRLVLSQRKKKKKENREKSEGGINLLL